MTIEEMYTEIFNYFCAKFGEENLQAICYDGILSACNVQYGENAQNNIFDIHFPADNKKHPTIFMIHGGGYVSGVKEDLNRYALEMLKRGFCVVNMEYTKCNVNENTHLPLPVREVFELFDFIKTNKQFACHIDFNNFFLAGDSAGGHIASIVASIQTNKEIKSKFGFTGGPKINGLVLVSPVFGEYKFLGAPLMNKYHNVLFGGNGEMAENCNIIKTISPNFPPSIIFTMPNDFLSRPQVKLFVSVAKKNNLCVRVKDITQGYKLFHDSPIQFADKYQNTMNEIATFAWDCIENRIGNGINTNKMKEQTILQKEKDN